MTYTLSTEAFAFECKESTVEHPTLWENHCHGQFEMIAVLEGDISIMLDGATYRLTEYQTAIIAPLAYHAVTANQEGTYRRITALFDFSSIPPVLRSHFTDRHISISNFSQIEELEKICKASDPPFYAPLAQSLMTQILYHSLPKKSDHSAAETDEFLQNVIAYIDRHLCEKIYLDDLAQYVSHSKSSFCHLFEKKMQVSPKQYILQKKLALARKLISEGTSPTIAAIQVGYSNYSNFYRMYKKHFGSPPTKNSEA